MSAVGEFFSSSIFFPIVLSLGIYFPADYLRKRTGLAVLNPLLITVTVTISLLVLFRIPYSEYMKGAEYLSFLLTPATVCLAVPLYRRINELRRAPTAIICGIVSGAVVSVAMVAAFALAFGLSREEYVSVLPKSITTAIGIGIAEESGGIPSLTAAAIMLTGVTGHIICGAVWKLFRITSPVARGVSLGTSAHAIGTSRAMEYGEIEGAVSGLSLVVTGIITVAIMGIIL